MHGMTRPYYALRHAEFRRLWLSQLVSQVGTQMQSVALHWHIYLLTGSPLALGLVGLTRALPTALFSLWGGVVADRRDRRLVMLAAQSAMTVVAVALAALTLAGRETLWALYVLNALGAAAGAFDNPSRQALVPRLVPPASLPGALAINLAMFQTALIMGPAFAGLLIAGSGAVASRAASARGGGGGEHALDRVHLRAERVVVPRRARRARHAQDLGPRRRPRGRARAAAALAARGPAVRADDARHGLVDRPRLRRHLLRRRDVAACRSWPTRSWASGRPATGRSWPRRPWEPSSARSTRPRARCPRARAGCCWPRSSPTASRPWSSGCRARTRSRSSRSQSPASPTSSRP